MKKRSVSTQIAPTESRPFNIEAEIVPGLEALAAQEIVTTLRKAARLVPDSEQNFGAVRFRYRGELQRLQALQMTQAVYLVASFAIPRPKALLGNEHFRIVENTIKTVINLNPKTAFRTFHISAAGNDTAVMRRFAASITSSSGLAEHSEQGDLWLRLRRSHNQNGWELLVRIGNRPLATRAWRTCNFEGALNATVAHAMTVLSDPSEDDMVTNLGSGSGSLLVERNQWGGTHQLIGIDRDPYAIACAEQNLAAAQAKAILLYGDIKKLPLKDSSSDVLLTDLPFGHLTGSHRENTDLYPAVLAEAGRIAKPAARFVVITHEVRLMDASLAASRMWSVDKVIRITLRGIHPRIYVLSKQR